MKNLWALLILGAKMTKKEEIKRTKKKEPKKNNVEINFIDAESKYYADETDRKLINLLLKNSRMSNIELAEKLKVSEPTVRRRIDNLMKSGIIRGFAILLNYQRFGSTLKASINLKVSGTNLDRVASLLKRTKSACCVHRVMGKYNLSAEIVFEDIQELQTLIDMLSEMENIDEIDYHIVTHSYLSCPWTGI